MSELIDSLNDIHENEHPIIISPSRHRLRAKSTAHKLKRDNPHTGALLHDATSIRGRIRSIRITRLE
jgi:hypothetical protein